MLVTIKGQNVLIVKFTKLTYTVTLFNWLSMIRQILQAIWLVLTSDLLEERRIDYFTINDISLFYRAKQIDFIFSWVCTVKKSIKDVRITNNRQTARSARKRGCASHGWHWFCVWLVEKIRETGFLDQLQSKGKKPKAILDSQLKIALTWWRRIRLMSELFDVILGQAAFHYIFHHQFYSFS